MLNVIHSSVISANGNTDIVIGAEDTSVGVSHNAQARSKAVLQIFPAENWSAGTIKLQQDDDDDDTYTDIAGATLTGAAESPAPLVQQISLHEKLRINAASMAGDGARVVIMTGS